MPSKPLICLSVYNDPAIWFKHGKPVTGDIDPPYSSHLVCKTIKKARRVMTHVLDKYPQAVVEIDRWNERGLTIYTYANKP